MEAMNLAYPKILRGFVGLPMASGCTEQRLAQRMNNGAVHGGHAARGFVKVTSHTLEMPCLVNGLGTCGRQVAHRLVNVWNCTACLRDGAEQALTWRSMIPMIPALVYLPSSILVCSSAAILAVPAPPPPHPHVRAATEKKQAVFSSVTLFFGSLRRSTDVRCTLLHAGCMWPVADKPSQPYPHWSFNLFNPVSAPKGPASTSSKIPQNLPKNT